MCIRDRISDGGICAARNCRRAFSTHSRRAAHDTRYACIEMLVLAASIPAVAAKPTARALSRRAPVARGAKTHRGAVRVARGKDDHCVGDWCDESWSDDGCVGDWCDEVDFSRRDGCVGDWCDELWSDPDDCVGDWCDESFVTRR